MKRIVLAAVTCLSLLVAIPAVSAAYSSGHHAGRDHRPDDRGPDRNRPGDRHDEDNNPSCAVMLQQPGTTIRHAELRPSRGGADWEEIELGLQ